MLKEAVEAVRSLVRPATLFILLGAVIFFLHDGNTEAAVALQAPLGAVIVWWFKTRDDEKRNGGGS